MGYNVNTFQNQNHYITKYSKTGAGKYIFEPNRPDLPKLEITKFRVHDTVGFKT